MFHARRSDDARGCAARHDQHGEHGAQAAVARSQPCATGAGSSTRHSSRPTTSCPRACAVADEHYVLGPHGIAIFEDGRFVLESAHENAIARAARARRDGHDRGAAGVRVLRPRARQVRFPRERVCRPADHRRQVGSTRLLVGYQFLEHLGVEGGYGQTRTIRGTATVLFPGSPPFSLDAAYQFKGLSLRLLGVLPFDNGVTLVGGIGYTDIKFKIQRHGRCRHGLRQRKLERAGLLRRRPIRLGPRRRALRAREARSRRRLLQQRRRRVRDHRGLFLQALSSCAPPAALHAGTSTRPASGGSVTTIEYG